MGIAFILAREKSKEAFLVHGNANSEIGGARDFPICPAVIDRLWAADHMEIKP